MKSQSKLGVTIPKPYLVYSALLFQTGTDAPTAFVLENTLGTISYNYVGVGRYDVTSAGLFTVFKTVMNLGTSCHNTPASHYLLNCLYISPSNGYIQTSDINGVGTNGVLSFTHLEIRVYP